MSQIPSRASLNARRSRDRYAHCPVCKSADVDGLHVDRCEERERYRLMARAACDATDVPAVTGDDLWAHLNGRVHNVLTATTVVQLVIDLGWRPVVGSDPARLWTPASEPDAVDPYHLAGNA